jgi:hypothetical protein
LPGALTPAGYPGEAAPNQRAGRCGSTTRGEDTWEQVFAGESPNGVLLQGHLAAVLEEHQEDIALAFEDLIEAEEAEGNFIFDEVPGTD